MTQHRGLFCLGPRLIQETAVGRLKGPSHSRWGVSRLPDLVITAGREAEPPKDPGKNLIGQVRQRGNQSHLDHV
jgi:hypothetical protein